jgi:hypothetical protein
MKVIGLLVVLLFYGAAFAESDHNSDPRKTSEPRAKSMAVTGASSASGNHAPPPKDKFIEKYNYLSFKTKYWGTPSFNDETGEREYRKDGYLKRAYNVWHKSKWLMKRSTCREVLEKKCKHGSLDYRINYASELPFGAGCDGCSSDCVIIQKD